MSSIQRRLTLALAGLCCVLWFGGAAAAYLAMRHGLILEFDYAHITDVNSLSNMTEQSPAGLKFDSTGEYMPTFRREDHPDYFQLWETDGTVLYRSPALEGDLPQRAGATRAAEAAADHDDACRRLRERGQWKRQRKHQGRRCGSASATELPTAHAMADTHAGTPYFCAASHAAIARDSSSEKPLAMRFITVAGSEPSRNPAIAVTILPASRPYSREIDEAAVAPAEWQPEQDAAPGGGSEAASTGRLHATAAAIPTATRKRTSISRPIASCAMRC